MWVRILPPELDAYSVSLAVSADGTNMKKILFVFCAVFIPILTASPAYATGHKTTICHITAGKPSPKYVKIRVNNSSLPAHSQHERYGYKDIIPAPEGPCPGPQATTTTAAPTTTTAKATTTTVAPTTTTTNDVPGTTTTTAATIVGSTTSTSPGAPGSIQDHPGAIQQDQVPSGEIANTGASTVLLVLIALTLIGLGLTLRKLVQ